MRAAWPALAITLLLQMMVAAIQMVIPVLAPVLTAEAGVAPERIGNLSSIMFVGSLWFLTINSKIMPRTGPLRLLQFGNLLAALGLLMVLPGSWPALMAAALLIGVGYGPTPPAGSQILASATPGHLRGLVFSIKQSGVPLGGAIAGLSAPWLADAFGWRIAVLVIALAMVAAVVAVQPWRHRFDRARNPGHAIALGELVSPRIILSPFRAMKLAPGLIVISLAGAAFAMVQGSVFSFLVTYLVDDKGMALAAAGFAFATMQVVATGGRITTGWFADRIGSGRKTLILLAGLSAVMTVALTAIEPGWNLMAVATIAGAAGFAIASWNGVYLAEIARISPPRYVGDVTAGSTFFTFIGYVVGPSLFGTLVAVTGGYFLSFLVVAGMVGCAGFTLWVTGRSDN
jgi:MFS family permease